MELTELKLELAKAKKSATSARKAKAELKAKVRRQGPIFSFFLSGTAGQRPRSALEACTGFTSSYTPLFLASRSRSSKMSCSSLKQAPAVSLLHLSFPLLNLFPSLLSLNRGSLLSPKATAARQLLWKGRCGTPKQPQPRRKNKPKQQRRGPTRRKTS